MNNPLEFGVVIVDEHHHITRFLEKPSWGEIFSDTINTGIYMLDPGIFEYMEAGKSYDFSRDLFPRLMHEGKLVQGFITQDYWTDIGNLQQYQQANYDALSGRARARHPRHANLARRLDRRKLLDSSRSASRGTGRARAQRRRRGRRDRRDG